MSVRLYRRTRKEPGTGRTRAKVGAALVAAALGTGWGAGQGAFKTPSIVLAISTASHSLLPSAFAAGSAYSDGEILAVETPDEGKIRELRDEEIRQLRITLGRRQTRNRQAELYFRLAELYLEAYHQTFLQEGRVHEKLLSEGRPSPVVDRGHSRPYLSLGIKACQEILATGIQYEKMDQIYYFLGFNYGELENHKESVKYFAEIIRRFPSSPFVAEAYRELGDDAFDQLQFRKAQGYYEQAVQKASEENAPRLYHKLAWAYYRTKSYDRAIDAMKSAIALSEKSGGDKYLSLRDEALRDMALFMTESGRVDEAITYFRQVVPDQNYYSKVLERLGKQYERNVEPAKATQVYESLLRTNPDSEAAFRVLVKLVDLDLRRSRFQDALARIAGAKLPSSINEDETRVALTNLRAMVRRTATEHHEKYRKHADRAALALAESYYQSYLHKFLANDDPRRETPEIQMYLAEVERELGKSQEASTLYRSVVISGDPRYSKEAAALWTASLADAVKKNMAAGGHSNGAGELSSLEKEYVQAADDLQGTLGGTAEGREAALKAAQILAGYPKTRPDSIDRIKKIIDKAPSSPQALVAARLWVQLEADAGARGDSSALKDVMQEIRANSALMAADGDSGKGKLQAALAELDTRMKIATIATEEKDKDYVSAAKGYESFAQDAQASGKRDVAEKAYADAVASYLKAGDDESVERVLEAWLKRFPKSQRAVDSFRVAATRNLIRGKFEVAAQLFERVGTEAADGDSLVTAARVFEATGDAKRAQADYAYHAQYFRSSAQRPEILLTLARTYEGQQMDREAVQSYRDCMAISPEWEARCGVQLADVLFRLKNDDEARAILQRIAGQSGGYVQTVGRTSSAPSRGKKRKSKTKSTAPASQVSGASQASGEASPYVAYARFKLADLLEQSRKFEPLELPDTKLKAGMTERVQFLEPLSRAYDSAIQAGGPWAVAAFDRLARFAANFADDVDRISPPAGLDEKALAQFRANLSAISGPLRRKAQDSWMNAYQKAEGAEVLSPAMPAMADHLADLGKTVPARAQGFRGKFRMAGIAADGGKEGADKALERTRDRLLKNPQDAQAWVDYGNLLSGQGHPLLARIAYERAVGLDPRNPVALNNRAVTLLSDSTVTGGEEDWFLAAEASSMFAEALKKDEFFVPAKLNRALLLNYYRLFRKAKPLLEQILVRNDLPEAHDALGVALQGLGDARGAMAEFDKATALGLDSSRFAVTYHRAARASAKDCDSALGDVSEKDLGGFERQAYEDLKESCIKWNSAKK